LCLVLNAEIQRLRLRNLPNDANADWFQRHVHLNRSSVIPSLIALHLVVTAVPFVWYSCERNLYFFAFVYIQVLPGLILLVKLAFKVRDVNECFYIKREMKREAILGILFILGVPISFLLDDNQRLILQTVLGQITLVGLVSFAFVLPLYYSYRPYQKPVAENLSMTLEQILGTEIGRRLFAQHLTREFSVENLVFVSAVNEYKKMDGSDAKVVFREACHLYAFFIRREAPSEINLSAAKKIPLEAELGPHVTGFKTNRRWSYALSKNDEQDPIQVIGSPQREAQFYLALFDKAYEEIMLLLQNDSFVRFQQSDLFDQLCRTV